MMARRLTLILLFLFLALVCSAKQAPPPQIVDLKAADGAALKATYFAAGKPGPGVLLLHQCNRQRKIWNDLAQQLAAAGINVLTLDFRGFGESSGKRFADLSAEENAQTIAKFPADVDTAYQFLVSQSGVKRDVIGVGGASCGVSQSIQTAQRHPEVKSLALLSGFPERNTRQFLKNAASMPVFISAAADDEFGPVVELMQWLFNVSANPGSKFQSYATGGHGADMFTVHPELRAMIVDWFVTTLVKTPGKAPAIKRPAEGVESAKILELITEPGGAAKVGQMLADARRRDPKAVLFSEAVVNIIGYDRIQSGAIKDAVEILKLNANAFPDSPNVYDSLADAYLADGQKDLARQNAQEALRRLQSDTTDPETRRNAIKASAEQKLKQLGEASK